MVLVKELNLFCLSKIDRQIVFADVLDKKVSGNVLIRIKFLFFFVTPCNPL